LNVTVERAAYIHRKTVDKDLTRTRFITCTLAAIILTSGAKILKNKVRAFQ
jgi:transcription initiation factor TFIIIB Brf1 subunit/transcription initiation factor TFIIB